MVTLTPDGDAAPGLQMCRLHVEPCPASSAEASRLNNTMPQPAPTGFGTCCPRSQGAREEGGDKYEQESELRPDLRGWSMLGEEATYALLAGSPS